MRQRKSPLNSKGMVSDPGLVNLATRRETTQRRTASWQAIVVGLLGFVIVRVLLKVLLRFGALRDPSLTSTWTHNPFDTDNLHVQSAQN